MNTTPRRTEALGVVLAECLDQADTNERRNNTGKHAYTSNANRIAVKPIQPAAKNKQTLQLA